VGELYSEAIEIMRFLQKRRDVVDNILLTQAMYLAQFSFPLDMKLQVLDRIIKLAVIDGRTIWSLSYFREAFREAESTFHKGAPPVKGEMMKVSEILGMRP
jgi:hypothetical protein